MHKFIILLLFIPFTSFSQYLKVKKGIEMDTLFYQVKYSRYISEMDEKMIDNLFLRIENNFNSQPNNFKIFYVTDDMQENQITIFFDSLKIADRDKKIAATIGTVLGVVVVPVIFLAAEADFFIFFWFSAPSTNYIKIKMSDNLIPGPHKPNIAFFNHRSSSGWSKSNEKNILKNYAAIEVGMMRMFGDLNKKLR